VSANAQGGAFQRVRGVSPLRGRRFRVQQASPHLDLLLEYANHFLREISVTASHGQ
jgi:hypothetical protein